MSQNGQTQFKNLAAFVDHFGTLYIKGLKNVNINQWKRTYLGKLTLHLSVLYSCVAVCFSEYGKW